MREKQRVFDAFFFSVVEWARLCLQASFQYCQFTVGLKRGKGSQAHGLAVFFFIFMECCRGHVWFCSVTLAWAELLADEQGWAWVFMSSSGVVGFGGPAIM